jgi:two-component system chemotaxis response regulator CheB
MKEPQQRDIVVIGASAGGIPAISQLVSEIPADLPAAVFIVVHMGPGASSRLPEVLTRHGPLRATHAIHGEQIQRGRIYVAPPDNHLVVRAGYMQVVRSARENNQRPSVDTLFRTASNAYGPRVIGVVLSGYLDCGTAGLLSIKARGGVALVQSPADAEVPDMPQSAVDHVAVDHVANLGELPALLSRLSREPAGPWPATVPGVLSGFEGHAPGAPVEIVCPSCQGSLTETSLGGFHLFRCHVGHAFSMGIMVQEQAEALEAALWAAARALEESASLAKRLAARSAGELRTRFEEKENTQNQEALLIRRMLDQGVLQPTDRSAAHPASAKADRAE